MCDSAAFDAIGGLGIALVPAGGAWWRGDVAYGSSKVLVEWLLGWLDLLILQIRLEVAINCFNLREV